MNKYDYIEKLSFFIQEWKRYKRYKISSVYEKFNTTDPSSPDYFKYKIIFIRESFKTTGFINDSFYEIKGFLGDVKPKFISDALMNMDFVSSRYCTNRILSVVSDFQYNLHCNQDVHGGYDVCDIKTYDVLKVIALLETLRH